MFRDRFLYQQSIDRHEVLKKMYADWNVFLRTERIKITRNKRDNLEFAQMEEAVRMLLEKDIQNTNGHSGQPRRTPRHTQEPRESQRELR